jgi:glutathione S-transferase
VKDLNMATLYQFPISHYCEKARWALDYKNIDYKVVNLLPGLHVYKTRKIASHSFVPILKCGGEVIQGSDKIITFLDEAYPERSLTPAGEDGEVSLKWERYVDQELGPHVRRCCYQVLLEYPDIVIDFFSHQGPFYGKLLLKLMFPKLKKAIRESMDINEKTAGESKRRIEVAVNKLYDHLRDHAYLAGSQFSRADLAAASLIAPLRMPEKYGLIWPEKVPAQLTELMERFSRKTDWVDALYAKYR